LQFSVAQFLVQILLLSFILLPISEDDASSRAIPVTTMVLMVPWYACFPQNVGASLHVIPVVTMALILPSYAHVPQNVGASSRAIPVATMALMVPWYALLPNSKAAAAKVGISLVFNFIWLVTLLTAPWWPLKFN
jgi:hypothetical protein